MTAAIHNLQLEQEHFAWNNPQEARLFTTEEKLQAGEHVKAVLLTEIRVSKMLT